MKLKHIYLPALLGISLFTSCSDDDDSLDATAPEIIVNEPTNDAHFHKGEEIHLDVDLLDNEALASYKIEIHSNFDGHTHGEARLLTTASPWAYQSTENIEGNVKEYNIHQHIVIPEDILEGAYHLGITAIDHVGNQNQAFIEIEVGDHDNHGDTHTLSIENLIASDVAPGSDIHTEAALTAAHGIQKVVVNIHGHGLNPTGDEIAWTFDQEYTNYSGTSATFHEHIDVPANATEGEYHITLTLIDNDGEHTSKGAHFHINHEAGGHDH